MEGDIVVGRATPPSVGLELPPSVGLRGVVISEAGMRWPNAIVPFQIDAGFFFPDRIMQAIDAWQACTAIRFRDKNPTDVNFVVFRAGIGDSSAVGMAGGAQFVDVEQNAPPFVIAHEIGHVIGLWHEQSRADRDQYVRIVPEHIRPGSENQFAERLHDGLIVGPYDYDSLMHYPKNAFAKDPSRDTIVTPHGERIGQRDHISAGDVLSVSALYSGA